MGKQWKLADFIFLGSKITADGDCSHEIKKTFASWMESYDIPRQNIKKQRYHFSDKVPYNQSMVFPVDVSGCEIWIIKKPESQRIDAFKLWC